MKKNLLNEFRLRAIMLVALVCTAFTGAWADEVTDVLNREFTGVSGTSYSTWSGKTATSGAVYAGQSAGGNESIQLRSNNNNSGVITTTSGGKVKKITVVWQSGTSNGRTLNVYGKNSAYSEATDLYDGTDQGTLIGTIVCGTSTELTVDDDYEYIGFRSASGAMYLTSVSIVWETAGGGGGTELEDCDLALTGAPIALNFDLYNNATAQTIYYTTSSTGEVSVEAGKYDVSCYVDEDAKTITVTPFAMTNGSQTVTVNQAADENYKAGSVTFTVTVTDSTPKTGAWVLTSLAEIEEGDVFVIVGDNGSNYAISNDKGTSSAPVAVAVTIEDEEITSDVDDNIKWNISGNAADGYTFYPDGNNETWLYCTNTNNGVRVGTNDAKTFTIDSDYLKHSGTSRYVGIYNSQDWRCYTSINANIANQTFAFYKYVDGTAPQKANPELSFSSATAEATFGQDFTAPTLNAVPGFDGTVEYSSSDETVARVMDIETGELRIVGGGTTVITATFAGNDTYKKGSASYTLKVTDNRVATTITQENITIDIADIATLTQLTPVVKDADGNIISYTNDPNGEGLPDVYFEALSDDNGILGSFDSHGNIILNSIVGTVTIKAVYNRFQMNSDYRPSECTFTVTVAHLNGPGTENNPYTVAQARAAIDAGTGVTGVYAKGIVSKIVTAYNSQFGNITYNISVDGSTEGEQLQAYRGFSFNGEKFTSEYDILVGDEVVIYGNLTKYKTTYEFAQNNQLVSLVRKPIKVTIGEAGYATAYMPYPITFAGAGAPDAEDLPTPIGAWTFNDPENPLAGTGTATLTPANHSTAKPTWLETKESLEEANIEVIDGGLNLPKGSSLLMNTNNGATGFDRYTVMFDICSDDMSGYTPLWQNSMDDSKDGSLFIKNGQMGLGGSLGYNGNFSAGVWYRVVLVIDTPNKAALYVDGELLSYCENTDSYNKHWLLQGPGAVFFADEDGEEKAIKVTGLRFWNVPFTAEQVAALGTVAGDSSEEDSEIVTVPETTGAWTFEGGTPNGMGVATMTATAGVIANEDGSITVDENNSLELTTNLPEESLSSYTLMMDVKFPDVARYTALIQTDLDNVNDAGLFVHNGQIGINSAGMYYHGALENDTWYRITFVVKDLYAEEYVDGKLIGKSSAPLDKWGIGTGLFLFEDENDDNDEGIATVKGIQFWNEALTPIQIAMLGTVGSDGTVKAYTGKITDNYLSLTEVEGTIPAKTPVILKGAPGTYFFEIGGNAAEVGENDLKGTFEEIDAVGKYVLAKPEGEQVGFYQAESGTIAAGKAYLELPDASGIKVFYFGGESATGINAIDNGQLTIDNAAIYNLNGQRVSKAQKGIYIINGKKVLVK